MPSQLVVRMIDGRPFELQDLLPADGRWKVVLFPGDTCVHVDSDDEDAYDRAMAARDVYRLLKDLTKGKNVDDMFSIVQVR